MPSTRFHLRCIAVTGFRALQVNSSPHRLQRFVIRGNGVGPIRGAIGSYLQPSWHMMPIVIVPFGSQRTIAVVGNAPQVPHG